MKFKMKKFVCILLVLVLVLGALAGCGEQQTSGDDSAETAQTPAETVESGETVSESDVEDTDDVEENTNKIVFPLEEPAEFEICLSVAPFAGQYITEITDFSVFREMEERTNVIFDGLMIPATSTNESINTIIAGGEYPDVFPNLDSYSSMGALQNYIDGVIIDLSDYIAEYAPDFTAALSPDAKLAISYEYEGEEVILGYTCLNKEAITSNITGMQYRADWLEETGLEVPTTLSELCEVVKAFKVNYDATVFVGVEPTGLPIATGLNINCSVQKFNTLSLPAMVKDGEVVASFMQDEFYTYLQYAHEWYEEGYIDSDFMSGESTIDSAVGQVTSGEIGIYTGGISIYSTVNATFAEEGNGASVTGGKNVVPDGEEDTHVGEATSTSRSLQWCVSSSCEHPEIITAWVNYMFTDEGYILFNYGVEGEGLQYNEEGEPELTDLVLQNPNGDPVICTEYVYCMNEASGVPGILNMDKNLRLYSDDALEMYYMWKEPLGNDWRLPKQTKLSSDELETANKYIGDLSTYYDEMILRFVVEDGTLTEDAFDEFRNRLVELGINEIIGAYQSAVDNYNRRLENME